MYFGVRQDDLMQLENVSALAFITWRCLEKLPVGAVSHTPSILLVVSRGQF
jgi:hypothetical protein